MRNVPPLPHSSADLLDVVRRMTPASYWKPLEQASGVAPGWDVYAALADLYARASLAAVRPDLDYRVDTAPFGSLASCQVTLRRLGGGPALSVEAGSVVTLDGRAFTLSVGQVASWGAGANGDRTVTVESQAQSYQANVRAGALGVVGAIYPQGQTLTGLSVVGNTLAAGGTPRLLQELGASRGCYCRAGEDPETYRQRVKTLADSVSMASVRRAVDSYFAALGLTAKVWEGVDLGPAADVDAADEPTTDIQLYAGGVSRGGLVVEVPNVTALLPGHSGCFADVDACDVDACDGVAWQAGAWYSGLMQTLDSKRPAGINVEVVFEE